MKITEIDWTEGKKYKTSRGVFVIVYNELISVSNDNILSEFVSLKKILDLDFTPYPTITEDERVILKNLDKDYKYIVRDIHGTLRIYSEKPVKTVTEWENYDAFIHCLDLFPNLFKFITWEDAEPRLIADLLKED